MRTAKSALALSFLSVSILSCSDEENPNKVNKVDRVIPSYSAVEGSITTDENGYISGSGTIIFKQAIAQVNTSEVYFELHAELGENAEVELITFADKNLKQGYTLAIKKSSEHPSPVLSVKFDKEDGTHFNKPAELFELSPNSDNVKLAYERHNNELSHKYLWDLNEVEVSCDKLVFKESVYAYDSALEKSNKNPFSFDFKPLEEQLVGKGVYYGIRFKNAIIKKVTASQDINCPH